jgi:hypothetical protein
MKDDQITIDVILDIGMVFKFNINLIFNFYYSIGMYVTQ